MKTIASGYISSVYCVLSLVWVTGPGAAFADNPTEPPAVKRGSSVPGYDLEIVDGQLVRPSGNFEPTLRNVIDALRDRYPEANIVMSPDLPTVKVGDLKLRAGRLTEELEAVRVASGEYFDLQTPGEPVARVDPHTGLPVVSTNRHNAGLFVLRESQNPSRPQRMVEAFNVGPYLEWLGRRPLGDRKGNPEQEGLDELQQMISQTVIDLKGEERDNQVKWRYHRGATLLVIIGSPDSVEIARKIVNALPGMSPATQANANRTAQQHAAEDAFRARYGLRPRDPAAVPLDSPAPDPAKP